MTHNLTIDTTHTYSVYAGADAVVTHNCGVNAPIATSGADDALNGVRLRAQLTGEEIAGGHAFRKHVVEGGEFPGITTRSQFAQHIEDVVSNGVTRALGSGRTAFWQSGTVVIRNQLTAELHSGRGMVTTTSLE